MKQVFIRGFSSSKLNDEKTLKQLAYKLYRIMMGKEIYLQKHKDPSSGSIENYRKTINISKNKWGNKKS